MPISPPQHNSGTCELHGHFSPQLFMVKIPEQQVENLIPNGATERSILSNPILVCDSCKSVIGGLGTYQVHDCAIDEQAMPQELLNKESPAYPLLEKLLEIADIFSDLISDVYLVPNEEVAGTRFAEKTYNVVYAFKNFSIQSYTVWVARNHKSAAHTWNSSTDRDKFWSIRTLRLLLALSKLHLASTQFNIWIASYTRIVSIEYFCTTPPRMVQLTPAKLYKVK